LIIRWPTSKQLPFDTEFDLLYNTVFQLKGGVMGYKTLTNRHEMDEMRVKYGPRLGLEGPFNFSGRVLYYDNKEGAYYDPRTDFYVDQCEMDIINQNLYDLLKI
jgi:hypothetical protein